MQRNIKNFLCRVKLGYGRVERPISLLIILWLVALLVIGAITKYTEEADEQEAVILLEDSTISDAINNDLENKEIEQQGD